MAFRAFLRGGVGEFLAQFEFVTAGVALVFVEWHLLLNLLKHFTDSYYNSYLPDLSMLMA
jgi:hypothetical protein